MVAGYSRDQEHGARDCHGRMDTSQKPVTASTSRRNTPRRSSAAREANVKAGLPPRARNRSRRFTVANSARSPRAPSAATGPYAGQHETGPRWRTAQNSERSIDNRDDVPMSFRKIQKDWRPYRRARRRLFWRALVASLRAMVSGTPLPANAFPARRTIRREAREYRAFRNHLRKSTFVD